MKARLLSWGNSFGLRLSRQDAQRLGLVAGDEVTVHVDLPGTRTGPPQLPVFHMGGTAADNHDDLFGESAADDLP